MLGENLGVGLSNQRHVRARDAIGRAGPPREAAPTERVLREERLELWRGGPVPVLGAEHREGDLLPAAGLVVHRVMGPRHVEDPHHMAGLRTGGQDAGGLQALHEGLEALGLAHRTHLAQLQANLDVEEPLHDGGEVEQPLRGIPALSHRPCHLREWRQGVQERHEADLVASRLELLGDLIGNLSSHGVAPHEVGPLGLNGEDRVRVPGGHVLDRLVRRGFSIEPARLEAEHGGAFQVPCQGEEIERRGAAPRDQKERGRAARPAAWGSSAQERAGGRRERNQRGLRRGPSPEELRELRGRRVPEQGHQGERKVEPLLDRELQLEREQGVAPQLEEAVVDPHGADAENLLEQPHEFELQGIAREAAPRGDVLLGNLHRGERAQVHLAVGRQGQRLQKDELSRNHVCRELLLHEAPEIGHLGPLLTRPRHHEGHQPCVPARAPHQRDRVPHGRMAGERGFDLTELDPIAAQLDLPIGAAGEEDRSIRLTPDDVARLVHPKLGASWEGVLDEARFGQLGPVQVTARQAGPSEVELTGQTIRNGTKLAVQDQRLHAEDRQTDGLGRPVCAHLLGPTLVRERINGRLGGPVQVPDLHLADAEELLHRGRRQGLASHAHAPERGDARESRLFHQRRQQRGDQLKHGDAALPQHAGQVLRVRAQAMRCEHETRPGHQRGEQLPDRGIEAERGALEHAVLWAERQGLAHPLHVIGEARMLDQNALRLARRTRGEQAVGERSTPRLEQALRGLAEHQHLGIWEHRREVLLSDDHPGAAVLEHESQPLARVRRIERDVGSPRLEDPEQPHHHSQGALHGDGHQRARRNAPPDKLLGNGSRASLEFRVAERAVLGLDGHGPGGLLRLRRDDLVDSREAGHLLGSAGGETRALLDAQQIRLRDPRPGGCGETRDEAGQLAHHRLDAPGVEQVEIILEPPLDALPRLLQRQGQIELGSPSRHDHRLDLQARQLQPFRTRLLEGQHDLEDRARSQGTLRVEHLDELLEGNVLVLVGREHLAPHALDEFDKGRIPTEIDAERQRVHEEANQRLRLGDPAAREGRADDHIVLPAHTAQVGAECREERHVGRHALLAAERGERLHRAALQLQGFDRAAMAPDDGPGPIRRKLQNGRSPRERAPPIGELLVTDVSIEPAPLPRRVVRVLNRKLWERQRLPSHLRRVELRDLAHHDAERPAVRHDVVHHHQEHMLLLGGLEQVRADNGTALEHEGTGGLFPQALVERWRARAAEILRHQGQVPLDQTGHRLAIHEREAGAQGLVTIHHPLEAARQRALVELSSQGERNRDVVRRTVSLEFREEAQALLRERERTVSRSFQPHQRRELRRGLLGRDHRGQGRERWLLEDGGEWHLDAKGPPDTAHHLGRQERVAPQLEEVVPSANRAPLEQFLPERRQGLLRGSTGGLERRTGLVLLQTRRRQTLLVHLATGGEGELLHQDDLGGHHELRETLPGVIPDGVRVHRPSRDHIGHQELHSARGPSGMDDDHRLRDPCVGGEHRFDLTQLDPVAAQLDLVINAPEVLEVAVLAPPHQVSTPVQPLGGLERMGDELLPGEFIAVQITPGHPDAPQVKLSRNADGEQFAVAVEDIPFQVQGRPADRRSAGIPLLALAERADDGHLRRTVRVDELHAGLGPRVHDLWREGLARREQKPERGVLPIGGQRRVGSRGQHHVRDPVVDQHLGQLFTREQRVRRGQHEPPPVGQGHDDLPHRHVEGDRRELKHDATGVSGKLVPLHLDDVREPSVLENDALRLSRGPRCVDDVGRILHADAAVRIPTASGGRGIIEPERARVRCTPFGLGGVCAHEEPGTRVLEDGVEPGLRIRKVERDVGCSRLPDREQADDQLEGARDRQRDQLLGPGPEVHELVRGAVRPLVELAVRQDRSAQFERDRVRRALRLLLHQLVDGNLTGRREHPPLGQRGDGLSLFRGEEQELREPLPRVGHGILEDRQDVPRHPLDAVRVEEVRAVLDHARQLTGHRLRRGARGRTS
ncbi:conserved hypothetical protein, partial [Stigmatella aurantiaca DW4/3-1]